MRHLLLLPLVFILSPARADITHTMQNVVSVSTVGASAVINRVGSSLNLQGTNVTPSSGDTSGALGTLDLSDLTSGVPSVEADTTYAVTDSGSAWSVQETLVVGDSIPDLLSGTVTNGVVSALPLFGSSEVTSGGDPGSVSVTLDSTGGGVTLTDMGAGTTAVLQSTITLEID